MGYTSTKAHMKASASSYKRLEPDLPLAARKIKGGRVWSDSGLPANFAAQVRKLNTNPPEIWDLGPKADDHNMHVFSLAKSGKFQLSAREMHSSRNYTGDIELP